jgi:glycosyltransferase involved in cell wall biosynthesis
MSLITWQPPERWRAWSSPNDGGRHFAAGVSKRDPLPDPLKLVIDGIIYQYQATGGISRLFTETLPWVCRLDEGIEITLFTTGPLSQRLPQHQQIRHRPIPPLWRNMDGRARQAWIRLWIGSGAGAIWHSTYFTRPRSWKGPQVVTVADMIYERFPDLFIGAAGDQFREQRKQCVLAADAVLCISDGTRRDVEEFYQVNSGRLHVVHLACSDFFRPLAKGDLAQAGGSRPPFFLYVGSRAHYKNFRGLLDAYSKWRGRAAMRLVVVGQPWTSEEGRRLSELGISGQVELLTDVRDEALCTLYNQAAAFIYPSLYEGFGIPLLEAMACGCPVVASRIPTTEEVAGDCCIYFELDRPDSMIDAFDKALSEGRGGAMARAGLEHAGRFSWEKTAQGTLDVYRSLSQKGIL